MTRSRAAAFASGASFVVYLTPLIGPHAMWFLGESLLHGPARRAPQWLATNFAVAIVLQLVAATSFYWFFRNPGLLRGVVIALAALAGAVTMQGVFLVAIPTVFLEEKDSFPETVTWPQACTAPGVSQTNLRTSSEIWLRFNAAPYGHAVLTMDGCKITPVHLPQAATPSGPIADFILDPISVANGARAIVQKQQRRESRYSWWLTPGSPLLALDPPASHSTNSSSPVLSTDGKWVGWLESIPNTGPPVLHRIFLRSTDPGTKEQIVDLSASGPATYSLLKVDMRARELHLWKFDHLVSVNLDGTVKKKYMRPPHARAQQNTYIEMGDHWLAWDAYRDEGRYLIEWSLPSGSGSHQVPLGRSIHSAAVDPSGQWIALSLSTGLNIGSARDSVYVLSAASGKVVFRRYLPRYSRTPVAFLEGGYFAFSDPNAVTVYRTPQ